MENTGFLISMCSFIFITAFYYRPSRGKKLYFKGVSNDLLSIESRLQTKYLVKTTFCVIRNSVSRSVYETEGITSRPSDELPSA